MAKVVMKMGGATPVILTRITAAHLQVCTVGTARVMHRLFLHQNHFLLCTGDLGLPHLLLHQFLKILCCRHHLRLLSHPLRVSLRLLDHTQLLIFHSYIPVVVGW